MPAPLSLPEDLTIHHVAELQPRWLAWLAGPDEPGTFTLDGREVQSVDSAGVQLLLALAGAVRARQGRLHLIEPSAELQACLALYGLNGLFEGLEAAGVAA